jgi:hypothetical protein
MAGADSPAKAGSLLISLGTRDLKFPQSDFDGDLPNRGQADEDRILILLDRLPGLSRQMLVFIDEPEQGMGIEQNSHFMYSAKSSSGASKSGAI